MVLKLVAIVVAMVVMLFSVFGRIEFEIGFVLLGIGLMGLALATLFDQQVKSWQD